MIYDYEANILRYINHFDSTIKKATYADEISMFNAMESITLYPAFFYYREETGWEFNKIMPVREVGESKFVKFVPFVQNYIGRVVLESQAEAQQWAAKLRFYWNQYPYLSVAWPDKGDDLRVGLRLLYIKIIDNRNAADRKGAARFVEFKWMSQLFMDESDTVALTNKINIYLRNDGLHILDENAYLIKVIE